MTKDTIARTMALGAVSGIRSMAGVAALAPDYPALRIGSQALVLGEMVVDKTPFVGRRTDPLPLAGRAAAGALVGGLVAREQGDNVAFGALLGACTAIAAAHVAFWLRSRARVPNAVGGLIEDAVVYMTASRFARAA